jgi:hypothetical protein
MSVLSEIAFGAGGTLGAGAAAFLFAAIIRVWKTPKRIDRLERAVPILLRSTIILLRCQKNEPGVESVIAEMDDFLSDASMSQKAKT